MDNLSLFDNDPVFPPDPELVITSTQNRKAVDDWYGQYHYSGTAGTSGAHFYAVHAGRGGDVWLRVAVGPTSNTSGLEKKFGLTSFPGNWEITRIARHPKAPCGDHDGNGSYFTSRGVAAVLHRIHEDHGWEWVFSYSDTGQNHHGGVYQALNAIYVGVSAARDGWEMKQPDGSWEPMHPRSVVSRYGTQATISRNGRPTAIELAARRGEEIRCVKDLNTAKHTYILPIGDKKSRRAIRQTLAPFVVPYPKRTVSNG